MEEALRPAAGYDYDAERERAVRGAARPTAREWARHAGLLLLTALTTTFAGVMLLLPPAAHGAVEPLMPSPDGWPDYLTYVPLYYGRAVAALVAYAWSQPALLASAGLFSAALLSILLAHEAGHYVACRRYGVRATLPFFIPAPPLFLAGTFGAFIKIKSPIPTRRALFDIGVAGPLAGFAVILPVALAAVLTAEPSAFSAETAAPGTTIIVFNDPPLLRLFGAALGADITEIAGNPFYFAAWIGLLVTSLNLLPVGQLDGGHAVFAVFGRRAHARTGLAAFALMLSVAVLGWLWHHAPGGFVYAVLLFVMLRVPHPQVVHEADPLGRARLAVAALTLLVFLLSFEPFPISIQQ
ncbi:MAG TPA: site-2 protease family protein [Pyrinomonadaceae bacterium]